MDWTSMWRFPCEFRWDSWIKYVSDFITTHNSRTAKYYGWRRRDYFCSTLSVAHLKLPFYFLETPFCFSMSPLPSIQEWCRISVSCHVGEFHRFKSVFFQCVEQLWIEYNVHNVNNVQTPRGDEKAARATWLPGLKGNLTWNKEEGVLFVRM